jgi:hypothetical protein
LGLGVCGGVAITLALPCISENCVAKRFNMIIAARARPTFDIICATMLVLHVTALIAEYSYKASQRLS